MPRGDGTGPAGQGPMTGRGMGYCAGYNQPGYISGGYGRGMGYGRGRGPGWRRNAYFNQPAQPAQPAQTVTTSEKQYLKDQADALQQELKAVKERLSQLED